MNWVLVGLGGMLGSCSRYGITLLLERYSSSAHFPFGILAANVMGCFLAGVVLARDELGAGLAPELRVFLVVGFLGGFTTFSAFGMDTHAFLQEGQLGRAIGNVLANVVVGTLAVWAGVQVAAKSS